MPELPEVETIASGLRKMIVGKTIKEIEIKSPKSFIGEKKEAVGQKITDIKRRAKMLFFHLGNGKFLAVHLKLTGQLVFGGQKSEVGSQKYNVVLIIFGDGSKLYFNDLRKFGWMKLLDKKQIEKEQEKFGLEPFTPNFDLKNFNKVLARYPKKTIRDLLMEQDKIAGIGNIYASEILYDAGVLPARENGELKPKEIKKIFISIEKILKKALKTGGASDNSYVKADGSQGEYMKNVLVYHQKKCPKGHIITREKTKGRSSFFCPKCQR